MEDLLHRLSDEEHLQQRHGFAALLATAREARDAIEEQHYWQRSLHDCPACGARLREQVCVDRSCRVCLGVLDGYRCDNCGWSGDSEDLRDAIDGAEA